MPLPFALLAPPFTPQARLASSPAGSESPFDHDSDSRHAPKGGSETRPYTPPHNRLNGFSDAPPLPTTPAAPAVAVPPCPSSRTTGPQPQTPVVRAPGPRPRAPVVPPPEDFSSDEPPVFSPPSREECVRSGPPPPKEDLPWWEFEELCHVHKLPPPERLRGFCKLSKWVRAELREALDEFMTTPPDDPGCRCRFEDPFWDPTPFLAPILGMVPSKLQAYVREGSGHSVSQWWDILRAEDPKIGVRARLRNELQWLAAACTFTERPTYPDLFAAVRHQRRLRGRTVNGRAWLWGYRYPQRLNLAAFKVTGKTMPALEAHMLQEILRTWTYDCTTCRLFPNPSPATAAPAKPAQEQGYMEVLPAAGSAESADAADGMDDMDYMDNMDEIDEMDNRESASLVPALAVSSCLSSPTPIPQPPTPVVQAVSPCPSSPTPNPQLPAVLGAWRKTAGPPGWQQPSNPRGPRS